MQRNVGSQFVSFFLIFTISRRLIWQHEQILEPIYDVEITTNDEYMGDVMGDLQTRRAIIMGMDSDGHYQKIKARVPLAEMYLYSSTLRSLSQGKAKFHRSFAEYQPVTPDIQHKLMAHHKDEDE